MCNSISPPQAPVFLPCWWSSAWQDSGWRHPRELAKMIIAILPWLIYCVNWLPSSINFLTWPTSLCRGNAGCLSPSPVTPGLLRPTSASKESLGPMSSADPSACCRILRWVPSWGFTHPFFPVGWENKCVSGFQISAYETTNRDMRADWHIICQCVRSGANKLLANMGPYKRTTHPTQGGKL